jgi:putative ABC transport system permease protein
MKTMDLIRESLLNLRRRPLRTCFAAGGVAVGALSVALLLSVGSGLHNFVEAQAMAFSDPAELEVFPEPRTSVSDILGYALGQMGTAAKPIEEEQKERQAIMRSFNKKRPRFNEPQIALIRAMEGVARVETEERAYGHSMQLAGQSQRFRVDLRASFAGPQIPLVAGRSMDPGAKTPEAIVAWQWIESFGLKDAKSLIGSTILIAVSNARRRREAEFLQFEKDPKVFRELPVKVVGVTVETIASRAVFISRKFARTINETRKDIRRGNRPAPKKARKGEKKAFQGPQNLIVRARATSAVPTLKAALVKAGYGVVSLEDRLGVIGRIFFVIDVVLASVGIVAFLVASLGIANTLIMAVHERTAEIGLWKAMGARDGAVGLMFSFEAAAMGTLGGVMGIVGAVILGLIGDAIAQRVLVRNIVGYEVFVFPGWLIVTTILLSTVVSLIAGIFPARRAAKLAPVAALRSQD